MRTRPTTVLAALLLLPLLTAGSALAQVIYLPAPPPPPRVVVVPPWGRHVRVYTRVRWHRPRARVVVALPPPPEVVVQAPPPPPVYYYSPAPAPLPPIPPPLVAPAPVVAPPVYYAPPPVYYAPAPRPSYVLVRPAPRPVDGWRAHIGLGVRGTGVVDSGGWNNLGIGGEFLARVSNHLALELAAEYQHDSSGPVDRIDIPATFGMRIYIGPPRWVLSPYFVFAGGFDYAAQDLKPVTDEAYYFDGQLGGGLELRLGQHVALTADVRFDGKKRLDTPDFAVTQIRSFNGRAVAPLGDEYGAQFRLGAAVYF